MFLNTFFETQTFAQTFALFCWTWTYCAKRFLYQSLYDQYSQHSVFSTR